MVSSDASRVADVAVGVSWGGYFLSHVLQYNLVLQFVALIVSILASIVVIGYHAKRWNK